MFILRVFHFPKGGLNGDSNEESTEIFDVETNVATIGQDFPYPSYGHCGATQKSTMEAYFVGGRGVWGSNNWAFMPMTRVFNMIQRRFSTIASHLSEGRAFHACTVLEAEGYLITAGGSTDGWTRPNLVEILNLSNKSWTAASPLPFPTRHVWAQGDIIFNWDTELYQYEVVRNEWLKVENVPFELAKMRPSFVQADAGLGSFCLFT